MAWTDQMVEDLRKMWKEGLTTGEIGRRLGVSKNSIVGKVHRLGLSGRPSPIKKKSEDETSKKQAPKNTTKTETVAKPKAEAKPVEKEQVANYESAPKKDKIEKSSVSTEPKAKNSSEAENRESKISEAEVSFMLRNNTAHTLSPSGFTSLTSLDNHTCRWPIGDPKDENFHFCGKKVRLGQTYCEEHAALAYVKPNAKK